MLYPIELRVPGHIVTQTYLCLGLRLYLPDKTLTGMGRRANVSIPPVYLCRLGFADWALPMGFADGLCRWVLPVGGFCKRFSRETSVLSTVPST